MSLTGHRDSRVAESYAELNDQVQKDTSLQVEQHLLSLGFKNQESQFKLIQ